MLVEVLCLALHLPSLCLYDRLGVEALTLGR